MNRDMATKAIKCAQNGDKEGALYCIARIDKPEPFVETVMKIYDDPDKLLGKGGFIDSEAHDADIEIAKRVGIPVIKTTLELS